MDLIQNWVSAEITRMANEVPDEERCGIVVNGDVIEFSNAHHDRGFFFKIKEEDIKTYLNDDFIIWHTHTPDGYFQLTKPDIVLSKAWQHPIMMVQAYSGFYDFYDPLTLLPYDGRTWRTYHRNCYTLVQDFYENEFNIFLSDIYLDFADQFKHSSISKFELMLPRLGFKKIDDDLRFGDILVTTESLTAPSWHCSVVVKTQPAIFCLSQWVNRPSGYFPYRAIANKVSGAWRFTGVN